jgi:hypothetical protein
MRMRPESRSLRRSPSRTKKARLPPPRERLLAPGTYGFMLLAFGAGFGARSLPARLRTLLLRTFLEADLILDLLDAADRFRQVFG